MRDHHTFTIKILFILGWICLSSEGIQATKGVVGLQQITVATSQVEVLQLTSKVFDNTRSIRVLLPPDYHDPKNAKKHYPVIYFTDGLLVFRPNRINIEEVVHQLITNRDIPPIIAIGIDNGGATNKTKNPATDRANEFLPYPDVGFDAQHTYPPDPPNPQGKLFPRFLIDEVMLLIQQHYRIKTGPENTGLGGFSYGGVAALHTAMSRPGIFGKLLLESTPLWIGTDQQLLQDAVSTRLWPMAVYLGVGTKETDDEVINLAGKRNIELLRAAIVKHSPKSRLRIFWEDGATHEPASWRRRLPLALKFLWANSA